MRWNAAVSLVLTLQPRRVPPLTAGASRSRRQLRCNRA